MSDFDSDESPTIVPTAQLAAAPAPTSEGDGYWRAEAKKAFEARDQAQQDLRNQIQQGYDPALIDLVPKSLSPLEWKEQADRIVAYKGQATPNPTENVEPVAQAEPETPSATEQNLAAVAKGPSSSSATPPSGFTQDEILNIAMNDPERYQKLKDSGVHLAGLRDDPKHFGPNR